MKFKCVQDHWEAEQANFLGFGAKPRRKIKGITKGTTYDGVIFPIVTGDGNVGFGSVSTKAEVLIFNDESTWEYYHLNLFSPI